MKQLYFQFSGNKNSIENINHIIIGSFNKLAYDTLMSISDNTNNIIYLYGDPKVGKTSLVIKSLQQKKCIELSQSEIINTVVLGQYMKENNSSVILIDDLLPLSEEEEKNLFNLYNFVNAYNYKLIITSKYPIKDLKLLLPDLISRLSSSLVIKIDNPNDDDLKKIFFELLEQKQIIITTKVVNYIFNNANRTVSSLIDVIDKMEEYININQKGINLKNIKQILFYT